MNNELQACHAKALDASCAGQWDLAREYIEKGLACDARNADLLHLRGRVDLALLRNAEAVHWLELAVEASSDPNIHNSLCVALTRVGAFGRAADVARAGLDLLGARASMPEASLLWFNLGLALQLQDDLDEARIAYEASIQANPDNSVSYNNLGITLNRQGHIHSAIDVLRKSIERDASNLEAHSNLGHALLAVGRYRQAWPHFEHRWAASRDKSGAVPGLPPSLPIPAWYGQQTRPAEDRLLVLNEQGLGDSLQFCRYLPLALDRFAKVSYVCPPSLQRLLRVSLGSRFPGLEILDAPPSGFEDWNWYVSLMSLPGAFGTTVEDVPAELPYLRADPDDVRKFAARLNASTTSEWPRIGIAWAGGHHEMPVDRLRSLVPRLMDSVLAWPHANWVSLQKPDHESKRLHPDQRPHIIDWMDDMRDFADTAALIESLDLVIAADTSVAHLAGAMGKPVWLLNRFAGCWRWLHGREDSPWYPGMRIFTQSRKGDWDDVLARVLAELERARMQGTLVSTRRG